MQIERPRKPGLFDKTKLAQRFRDEMVIVEGGATLDRKGRVRRDRKVRHRQRLVRCLILTGQKVVNQHVDLAMGAGGKAADLAARDRPPQEIGLTQCGKAAGAVRIGDQVVRLAFEGDLVEQGSALMR